VVLEYGNKTYENCSLCNSEIYLCSDEGKSKISHSECNSTEGNVWQQNKAKQLSVNIPSGRIVSKVKVELTAVKMCLYESETPSVEFEFADRSSNDPNPLLSKIFLPDTCGCNNCPESRQEAEWSASEKEWRDAKEFTLDVNFQGGNSTLCIKALTIRLHFASEFEFIQYFVHSQLVKELNNSQTAALHPIHPRKTVAL
jgi:hypothetical protein